MVIRELLAFASGVFLLYVRILRGIHRDIFLSFLLTLCVLFLCCPSPRLMGQIFVVPSDAVFVVFRPSLLPYSAGTRRKNVRVLRGIHRLFQNDFLSVQSTLFFSRYSHHFMRA